MKLKLYLHIGVNKSGSSYIQYVLSKHRSMLKSIGILYPITGTLGNAHYMLSASLGFSPIKIETLGIELLKEKLYDEIVRSKCNTVIVSSEFFMLPLELEKIEKVKSFFSDLDVSIVVYLRRHDYWWMSNYNQAVKTVRFPPWGRGFENYYQYQTKKNKRFWSYRRLIDEWCDVFGKENILVRPYEAGQNKPTLIHDFMRTLGLSHAVDLISENDLKIKVNESLGHISLYFLDFYQRLNIKEEIYRKLVSKAIRLVGKKIILSPKRRRSLILENLDEYEYIAEKFLNRKDKKLFYEPLPCEDEYWQEPIQPSYEEVLEKTINMLIDDV